jgi:flagellar P-ring protein precursor FlgI
MTPLNAADGEIYAVAQGSVIAGGASATGDAATVTQGVPTAGSIPSGARIEREVAFAFDDLARVRLAIRDPDFTTAARIEAQILNVLGAGSARMLDSGTVQLDLARLRGLTPAQAITRIENLPVAPSQRARVVVDHRSGTIVLGDDVRISRIAVSQGGLTLRVSETPLVVQPNPFSRRGATVVVPRSDAEIVEEEGASLAVVDEAVTLAELVQGLNALGVSPRDMIDILKSIKAAGALHAEFIVQ